MTDIFRFFFGPCFTRHKKSEYEDGQAAKIPDPTQPRPHGFQLYPPPAPQEILEYRSEYLTKLQHRKYWPPKSAPNDTPLYALYRLYEFLVVDDVTGYRNTPEYFCKQRTWAVCDVPDPKDQDPSRYAFLACIPSLLVSAFDQAGLVRDIPAIMSPE